MMQKLRHWISRAAALGLIKHQHGHQEIPLLSLDEIEAIEHRIYASKNINLIQHKQSQYPQYGEDPSIKIGSGYDFADNRIYQAGDERRHINWRQYARSHVLYLKQFHEELNPSVVIMLDKRQSMIFGSRKRLKIQQAVIVALSLVFYSRQHGFDTGLLIIDEHLEWQSPIPIVKNIDKVVHMINSARENLNNEKETTLHNALNFLNQKVVAGSQIFMVSDFSDINESDSGYLWSLHEKNNLSIFNVSDELEYRLPEAGRINFNSHDGVVVIDSHNKAARDEYSRIMGERHQYIENSLKTSSGRYYSIHADEDAITKIYDGIVDA